MAPKRAAAPKPRAQPDSDIDQSVAWGANEEMSDAEKSVNVGFVKTFEDSIKVLLEDPCFANIQNDKALSPAKGGHGRLFSHSDYEKAKAVGNAGYDCVANIFIHDIRWRPFPSTPVNTNGIEEIIKHHYGQGAPDRVNFDITIAIDPSMENPEAEFGKLKRLSPEEPVYALLIAASRSCVAGDPEEKERFKRLLCNCKFTFLPMEASSIRRKAIDMREELRTVPCLASSNWLLGSVIKALAEWLWSVVGNVE